MTENFKKYHQ